MGGKTEGSERGKGISEEVSKACMMARNEVPCKYNTCKATHQDLVTK